MDVIPGAGLGPGAAELISQLLAILGADLALFGPQVALVADDADGDFLAALGREETYQQGLVP